MKKYVLLAFIALFCVSSSAWAQYVKLTAENGTVSWIPIAGNINGTKIELSKSQYYEWLCVIDNSTKGSLDLSQVWSQSGGSGTHYQVTSIGKKAFHECRDLTSVVIPSSVTSIEEYAFSSCSGLTSLTIPNSVTIIGDWAFLYCNFQNSITISNSVTSIGDGAFLGCSMTSITIPNSVTSIGISAFQNCVYLTSITIPNSVTSIGEGAFLNCRSLTSVSIPNKLTSIENGTFESCSSLTSITIPNSVTSIGISAFADCSSLTSVTIPNSVTSIGAFAFEGCTNMKSITSDIRNVFETGENAFNNCDNATLYVPKGLVSTYSTKTDWNRISNIKECWFDFCATNADGVTIFYKIVSETNKTCEVTYGIDKSSGSAPTGGYTDYAGVVNIPSSANGYKVIGIGDYAFAECKNLTSVTIPNTVTYIKEYAFYFCYSLTIEIPNSVTSIGGNAFEYCYNLISITIPNSVTSIGESAFQYCYNLTSITIPNSVTSIGESAFDNCRSLTSVSIPNRLTSIENGTFMSCTSLTSITIPNSVTSIGESAFGDCRSLTSITIPSSVTFIGAYAFVHCIDLTSITSEIRNVFETGENAFLNCENATLYVPGGTKDQYQNTADWNRFSNIEEIINYIPLSLSCNNRGKVIINEGVQFTNDMGDVSVKEEMDNSFIFQPNDNCALSQVLINGQDVTESILNNRLTMKVNKNSNMIVLFDNKGYDVNDDGKVDISDVVKLVNVILVQ